MKLYESIMSWGNLLDAYDKATAGALAYNKAPLLWQANKIAKLHDLFNRLVSGTYEFGIYSKKVIKDKKQRIIYVPCFEDKIVQYMINNVLSEYYKKRYIYDSYACVKGKGPQAAVLRLQKFQREAFDKWGEPVLLKMDISKYFYSIDRAVLVDMITREFRDPRLVDLLTKLINSFTLEEKGLPLGNLTSQLFANVYLNEFDHMVKEKLKVKYYVRYADDMFFILPNKEEARRVRNACRRYLTNILHLQANPEKTFIKSANSIPGLGFITYRNKIRISANNRSKLFKYAKKNKIKSLNSWSGYSKIANLGMLVDIALEENSMLQYKDGKFMYKDEFNRIVLN